MKKILIVHHGEGVGGGLIALLGLIDELKENHKVEVLCIFDSNAVEYIRAKGVDVKLARSFFYRKVYRLFLHSDASYFNVIDFLRSFKNVITYFLSKYHFAKRELKNLSSQYDIVYLNSTFLSDWALAGHSLEKKVFIHVREPLSKGTFGLRYRVIRNTVEKYCDWIVAISEDNARRVNIRKKTTVIYDPVVLKNRSGESEIVLAPNLKYFLYLGGMQRIKGFEQFVKSLDYLNENIRIFFLGGSVQLSPNPLKRVLFFLTDPFFWKMNSLSRKLHTSHNVINVGMVDNVFDYYEKSLAIISPFSKPHASLPILEAFFMAKPVIVSDVQGMDEFVNGDNGVFFKNHSFKGLADAINSIAELEPEHYQIMSRRAGESYLKLVNMKSVVELIEAAFPDETNR